MKIVGNNVENYISDKELVNLICESKIVINFSKNNLENNKQLSEKVYLKININSREE